jgi:GLPGLI family protein
MKTSYFIIFLIATFSHCFGQNYSYGSLYYKTTVGYDDWFNSLPKYMQEEYIKDKESEEYLLTFNKNASNFKLITDLNNNSNSLYYSTTNDTCISKYVDDPEFGKLIIKDCKKIKWDLKNETKIISGFKCFKAESHYEQKNGDKIFNIKLIAWFCPSIPVPFGPFGYGGLPGLILELQERNVVYGIYKIDFTKKQEIKMGEKGKIITKNEYSRMIQNLFVKE